MSIIYEPKGAAREYAPLAANLSLRCVHGCRYCYVPKILRSGHEAFHSEYVPRPAILELLEKDAAKLAGDPREILLCFTCDPYQNNEAAELTRRSLLIFEQYNLKATVLTKGGERACGDFDILARNNWRFGTSMVFTSDIERRHWEPNAASRGSRMRAMIKAKQMGIRTWLSLEPVIIAYEAMDVIRYQHPYVDHFMIGKINHSKLLDRFNDDYWRSFCLQAIELLEEVGASYTFKDSLQKYLPQGTQRKEKAN